MTSQPRFSGSVPELYEQHMVPLLMAPCAGDLARRAAALNPHAVLELAAGTGVLTRELLAALPSSASLTATDLNQPMLEIAQRLTASDRVNWRTADVQALPFDDGSFDVVVSQFGIMFVPDKVAAFLEARRVLRRGGAYLFNTWQPLSANPIGSVPVETLRRLYPENPPMFLARPFSYGDTGRIDADLREAGFTDVDIEPVEYASCLESPERAATALVYGTPMFHDLVERGGPTLDDIRDAIAEGIQRGIGGPGARLPLRIVVVKARG